MNRSARHHNERAEQVELRQDVLETRPRPEQHLTESDCCLPMRLCGSLVHQEGPEGKEKLKLLVNEYDQVLCTRHILSSSQTGFEKTSCHATLRSHAKLTTAQDRITTLCNLFR